MNITVFGSCRQDSLYNKYIVNRIKNDISYTHSTKEILEVIKFCKYGNMTPEETLYTFRTPLLNKNPILSPDVYKQDFENSELFVLEIASRTTYEYDNKFLHHIVYDDERYINNEIKDKIIINKQTDEEIEKDIIQIKSELQKPMIIVSHLVTWDNGERYDLAILLENICKKHDILFINPVNEIVKRGDDIDSLIENEFENDIKLTNHYNSTGHEVIQTIYDDYINHALYGLQCIHVCECDLKKLRIGSISDGGYVIMDNIDYDVLISCGISDDVTFENSMLEKYSNLICYAFDGTIQKLPENSNNKIQFIKKNIANQEGENTTNLVNLFESSDNIFLKMDIETNEFQWLEIMSKEHLLKCKQIVMEFHFAFNDSDYADSIFRQFSYQIEIDRRIKCLKNIAETHYLVHFHPNNCCGTVMYKNIEIPNVFECTYIRKDLCKNVYPSRASIPDPAFDTKNVAGNSDIFLSGYPFTRI
jgi:hypothetical protein